MSGRRSGSAKKVASQALKTRPAPTRRQKLLLAASLTALATWLVVMAIMAAF